MRESVRTVNNIIIGLSIVLIGIIFLILINEIKKIKGELDEVLAKVEYFDKGDE